MIRLHFIWTCHILFWASFALAITSTSNDKNDTSFFTFPDVKPDPYPILVQIPEGAINNFTKIGASTNNSFALAYVTVPPGTGPYPHIHHWTNEWFYYPEGGIVMYSSDKQYPDPSQIPDGKQLPKANMHRYHTKPGDLIYSPAFYVHGFRNEGNVSRQVILVWTPDKISQFFFEVGQIMTDPCKRPPIGDLNVERFVSEAPRHGMNMSSTLDEYVASWDDDWQPSLGMDANGQELLDLLGSRVVEHIPCEAPPSHAALLQLPSIFIYSIGFIIAGILPIIV